MRLVLATNNEGKVRELQDMLGTQDFEVVSLKEYPSIPEVEEDGATFKENAVKKAREISAAVGEWTMADDSGLEVDYLGGAPGVHSARFAGEHGDNEANNKRLLELLEGVPFENRTARFRCVVAVASPGGDVKTAEGSCEGIITGDPRGDEGFGYDPLFYSPEHGKTFAELDRETKNASSHRGRALRGARDFLKSINEK
ncbi:MAG: XTP/dITP diphosphatase [Clostridiales bacterium]|nr:XTP/dITP diphosphatase [Clostridiales bacterium]MCF8023784.1 XTP/dITP diphosphatase [Clostridiales bacterium]